MSAVVARRRPGACDVFQWLSYLQYPAMLVALAYAVSSVFALASIRAAGWGAVYDDWNYVLLYAGIGVGLSSLQDPRRTQNAVSLRVWQDPRKGRWMLALLATYGLGATAGGLIGAYMAASTPVSQLSLGLMAFGLGQLGLLKTAIEMRERHRLDRRHAPAEATP